MNTDRMTDEAMAARVALCYIAFEAQDNDDEATVDLALLLVVPTPAEYASGLPLWPDTDISM